MGIWEWYECSGCWLCQSWRIFPSARTCFCFYVLPLQWKCSPMKRETKTMEPLLTHPFDKSVDYFGKISRRIVLCSGAYTMPLSVSSIYLLASPLATLSGRALGRVYRSGAFYSRHSPPLACLPHLSTNNQSSDSHQPRDRFLVSGFDALAQIMPYGGMKIFTLNPCIEALTLRQWAKEWLICATFCISQASLLDLASRPIMFYYQEENRLWIRT